MHYNRKYDEPSEDVNDANAMRDTLDWLNEKQWAIITNAAMANREPMRNIELALCFAGVEGYPVFAFMRTMYTPEQYQQWFDALPEE